MSDSMRFLTFALPVVTGFLIALVIFLNRPLRRPRKQPSRILEPKVFSIRGTPSDDWPGIQGVEWGMGSRVLVRLRLDPSQADLPEAIHLEAMIVGAELTKSFAWKISVKIWNGKILAVNPNQIHLAKTPSVN